MTQPPTDLHAISTGRAETPLLAEGTQSDHLKARGATDYYALPVTSALGSRRYMATYVTDRATAPEIEELTEISQRLAIRRTCSPSARSPRMF
jgi:hypothetical protein